MINLMNYGRRRGVGILSSKEIRMIASNNNSIDIHSRCINDYCKMLYAVIDAYIEDGNVKNTIRDTVESIEGWSNDIAKESDKIHDVLI